MKKENFYSNLRRFLQDKDRMDVEIILSTLKANQNARIKFFNDYFYVENYVEALQKYRDTLADDEEKKALAGMNNQMCKTFVSVRTSGSFETNHTTSKEKRKEWRETWPTLFVSGAYSIFLITKASDTQKEAMRKFFKTFLAEQ